MPYNITSRARKPNYMHKRYSVGWSNMIDWQLWQPISEALVAAVLGGDPLLICDIKKRNKFSRHDMQTTCNVLQLSLNSFVHFPRRGRRNLGKGEKSQEKN